MIAAKDYAKSFILIIDSNRIKNPFVVTRLFQSPTRVIVGQTGYKQASSSARLSKPLHFAASPKHRTHLKSSNIVRTWKLCTQQLQQPDLDES